MAGLGGAAGGRGGGGGDGGDPAGAGVKTGAAAAGLWAPANAGGAGRT